MGLPDVYDIAAADDVVIAVSSSGVYALRQPDLRDYLWTMQLAPEAPVGPLVHSASMRPELQPPPTQRRALTALIPELALEGSLQTADALFYDPETGSTSTVRNTFGVFATLTFRNRDLDVNDLYLASPELGPSPGGALVEGGMGDVTSARGRNAGQYRRDVAREVTRLYRAHRTLAHHIANAGPIGVREAVYQDLELEELEARLDVLTGGAMSRWNDESEERTWLPEQ
jgi:hypothetical protein